MKKNIIILFLFLLSFPFLSFKVFAIYNPLLTPNNKFGVHILFPSEIDAASQLVNSSGGDWGYVTIPISLNDLDLQKWQTFMNKAKTDHLIPIIRLATSNDYFNTVVWAKPTDANILDLANFLNSLVWPTKNRYIIVFNEPNRSDEWDSQFNASEYAKLLNYAVTVFKSKNPDFFIISAGLDNAAANSKTAENEYSFLYDMNQSVPGIFSQIDGMGSHSYPNPAFVGAPNETSDESVKSFYHEEHLIGQFTNKQLPIFITETGWDQNKIPPDIVAQYFKYAFENVWTDKNIIAITPFLLEAGSPFSQFSILTPSGNPTVISKEISSIPKIKGAPILNSFVLGALTENPKNIKAFYFKNEKIANLDKYLPIIKQVAKYLLHL